MKLGNIYLSRLCYCFTSAVATTISIFYLYCVCTSHKCIKCIRCLPVFPPSIEYWYGAVAPDTLRLIDPLLPP